MPKTVEPQLEGDKFILVGYADDLAGQDDDFYQISNTPFIVNFSSDKIWHVPFPTWNKSQARALRAGDQDYVSMLTTPEHVLIDENQYMQIAGEKWLDILREVSPELYSRFDDWRVESGRYKFRYQLGEVEQHRGFNTELARYLEVILVDALKSRDEKLSSLAFHVYNLAAMDSFIPQAESVIVTGAYCTIISPEALDIVEYDAKLEKLYRNHRKWTAALTAYQKDKGL